MKREFYREIWSQRFKKMLQLEEKSVLEYQALIAECNRRVQKHAVIPHLEKLVADEKKHALLVKELIKILHNQKDELKPKRKSR